MKAFAYELTYDFPNDLILEILRNYKILGKSLKFG